MASPTYSLEIGFDVGANLLIIGSGQIGVHVLGGPNADGAAWTQVTGVQQVIYNRGRQMELDKIEAGRLAAVLDNSNGIFSPENSTGAYFGKLKPQRQIRFKAVFSGSTYDLWRGYIDRFIPSLDINDQTVTIEATDAFKRLARDRISSTMTATLTGTRVTNTLNAMGWPGSLRDIDAGQSTVAGSTVTATSPLQHIEDVMVPEAGLTCVSGAGKITFRDRHARLTDSASAISQATFGSTSLGYAPGVYDYSDELVYNDVRVLRTGGTEQTAVDSTSKAAYGSLVKQIESAYFTDDTEAGRYARWILGQYREPIPRLRSIAVVGGGDDVLWPHVLGRELNDRITVQRRFPGNHGLNRDFWIEGIRGDVTDGLNRHQVEWTLSAADAVKWLIIGVGQIGVGQLAY